MMKPILISVAVILCSALTGSAENCWTNTAGHSFTAELAGVTDSHACFIMSGGETNRLALAALSTESEEMVREVSMMPVIPDRLKPIYDKCRRDLKRLDGMRADKRVDQKEYAVLSENILHAFRGMCSKYSITDADCDGLEKRLLSGK